MAGRKMDEVVRCSFCGKAQAQVQKLIAGPNGAYICDECINICNEIIEEEMEYEDAPVYDEINLLSYQTYKQSPDR